MNLLAALKPSRRRIGATALIIFTALAYGVLNTALSHETEKRMAEAFLGEPLVTKMRQLNEEFSCERDKKIADLSNELSEQNSEEMLSVRNKWFAANLLILMVFAYLSACMILLRKISSH